MVQTASQAQVVDLESRCEGYSAEGHCIQEAKKLHCSEYIQVGLGSQEDGRGMDWYDHTKTFAGYSASGARLMLFRKPAERRL